MDGDAERGNMVWKGGGDKVLVRKVVVSLRNDRENRGDRKERDKRPSVRQI